MLRDDEAEESDKIREGETNGYANVSKACTLINL